MPMMEKLPQEKEITVEYAPRPKSELELLLDRPMKLKRRGVKHNPEPVRKSEPTPVVQRCRMCGMDPSICGGPYGDGNP